MISDLLVKAQQDHDQQATRAILECFTPKVKASLLQVPAEDQRI